MEKLLKEIIRTYLLGRLLKIKNIFFLNQKNNLILMGRATYDASKQVIKIEKGKLRIVLTHSPKNI